VAGGDTTDRDDRQAMWIRLEDIDTIEVVLTRERRTIGSTDGLTMRVFRLGPAVIAGGCVFRNQPTLPGLALLARAGFVNKSRGLVLHERRTESRRWSSSAPWMLSDSPMKIHSRAFVIPYTPASTGA
jgi:hypothetical protein